MGNETAVIMNSSSVLEDVQLASGGQISVKRLGSRGWLRSRLVCAAALIWPAALSKLMTVMGFTWCSKVVLEVLILHLLFAVYSCRPREQFLEELHLISLNSRHTLAYFKFTIISLNKSENHFNFFPNALGRVLNAYNVTELHLSLTQGLWRSHIWPHYAPTEPTGAHLLATFQRDTAERTNTNWNRLVHSLSGLFCASFSQIDSTRTVTPKYLLFANGTQNIFSNYASMRYGMLPSENVCTENLTPWKKLLPCKLNRGLTALLNPRRLFNAHYVSLAVKVTKTCQENNGQCLSANWKLVQSVTAVLDNYKGDWSLQNYFFVPIQQPCNIAFKSAVIVQVKDLKSSSISTLSASRVKVNGCNMIGLDSGRDLFVNELSLKMDDVYPVTSCLSRLPVLLNTHVLGVGFHHLTLKHRISNEAPNEMIVLFRQTIPWIIRVYFHTLTLICAGEKKSFEILHYEPAKNRLKPHYFELLIHVPALSVCHLQINFDKSLLRWTEYPPDANRGFMLPAASLLYYTPDFKVDNDAVSKALNFSQKNFDTFKQPVQVYGESLLLNLPTPDFSMPYNVICLVCTVVALIFGPIHNVTTKRLVLKHRRELGSRVNLRRLFAYFKRNNVECVSKFPVQEEQTN
ncbi:GPI transamidase component PIG-T [Trichinella patagoniensis]|uniref:GPI transamidase component PIG-T n=2 Tax=Trichinella TaxID=6333 RepID=A0A0V0ZYN9_9BILA|nr:GPI transamidase component PIG-T [Trichinella patagoniensis]